MDPTSQPDLQMSALEYRLLAAARHDRIPDTLGTRMAEGLGLRVPAAALDAGLRAGGTAGTPLFAKGALWGALSLGLIAAVAGLQLARPATPSSRAAPLPSAVERSAAATPVVALPPAAGAIEPRAVTPTHVTALAPPPARPVVLADDAELRAEIALLDRARNALREGASARALRLLDQHARRFARGALAPEGAVLRIEALVQRGSYREAESRSRAFVAAYPSHPLRERVVTLARGQ